MFVCPECAHEWTAADAAASEEAGLVVRDANGTLLADGDSVTVIKDLKIKGSSSVAKVGTKVKNIRLVDSDHNIFLQNPRYWPDGAEIGVRQKSLIPVACDSCKALGGVRVL